MRNSIFMLLLLLFSCDQKMKPKSEPKPNHAKTATPQRFYPKNEVQIQPWFTYYKSQDSTFKFENFKLEENTPISYQKSTIFILNEKGFNETYKPFLVFNKSKDKYIDFDSYHWFLEKDGSASFEADQQIVLVDWKKKKAQQIAFFGPSFWIEEAFWKDDSEVFLLGNSYEKVPFIIEFNLAKNWKKYYKYSDTLKFETSYTNERLRSKGIKTD